VFIRGEFFFMKFSAQEEYGLRCLLRLAQQPDRSLAIPEIAEAEGLSVPYVAKLMRALRQGGFVKSERGQSGGYALAAGPETINVGQVLEALGGRLIEDDFCERHTGTVDVCTHTVDCSIRSLWSSVQRMVDQVLMRTSLQDLLAAEHAVPAASEKLVSLSVLGVRDGPSRM
jgi:Rrf2 family protein